MLKVLREKLNGFILDKEMRILSNLRHPRIVMLMDVCKNVLPSDGGLVGLMMEFMGKCSLFQQLKKSKQGVVDINSMTDLHLLRTRLLIACGIAKGMGFLHACGVVHRDF